MCAAAERYLAARRSVGFKLEAAGYSVLGFAGWCDARGIERVTVEAAVEWAVEPGKSVGWHSQRLSAARGFARYLALRDPAGVVPPSGVIGARQWRRVPFIFSAAQVSALMEACAEVVPSPGKAAACKHLIGLLAATGMRIGEACGLNLGDMSRVTLPDGSTTGILAIREAKFGKSRTIPVLESTMAALGRYLPYRHEGAAQGPDSPLFTSQTGGRFSPPMLRRKVWPKLLEATGITQAPGIPRALPHSLRHSFAVATLAGWHMDRSTDVDAKMVWLSTYMGHVNPATTHWYLQAAPSLVAAAARRGLA
jgi:integrase